MSFHAQEPRRAPVSNPYLASLWPPSPSPSPPPSSHWPVPNPPNNYDSPGAQELQSEGHGSLQTVLSALKHNSTSNPVPGIPAGVITPDSELEVPAPHVEADVEMVFSGPLYECDIKDVKQVADGLVRANSNDAEDVEMAMPTTTKRKNESEAQLTQASHLLSLPLEIREMIYDYVYEDLEPRRVHIDPAVRHLSNFGEPSANYRWMMFDAEMRAQDISVKAGAPGVTINLPCDPGSCVKSGSVRELRRLNSADEAFRPPPPCLFRVCRAMYHETSGRERALYKTSDVLLFRGVGDFINWLLDVTEAKQSKIVTLCTAMKIGIRILELMKNLRYICVPARLPYCEELVKDFQQAEGQGSWRAEVLGAAAE